MDYKEGDEVLLKRSSKHYTGPYAGTLVKVKRVDSDLHFTAIGFDGKEFMCPLNYVLDIPVLDWRKCECGAEAAYGKDCQGWLHSTYCPKYKKRED